MITYEKIVQKPQVANSLIGMSLAEFEKLYAKFETAHLKRESTLQYTRRHKMKRKRAVGAGRKHKYDMRDRLLMTLFWLRAYTSYQVLGFIYDLNRSNVEDYLKNVLDTLATVPTFHFELPQAEVPKMRTFREVMDAFPEICLIIDTKE